MSFLRHREIYRSDVSREQGAAEMDDRRSPAHRLDESPAGYSWRVALQQSPLLLLRPYSFLSIQLCWPSAFRSTATCHHFPCLS